MALNVLVAGGTGFIGQHLIDALLRSGFAVSLLLREHYSDPAKLPSSIAALRSDVQIVFADLRNYHLTTSAIRQTRPDGVIHLAARGATDPYLNVNEALRNNLNGTINLLRACFESTKVVHRPAQVVVARTPGESAPSNSYTASKAAAWSFCHMYTSSSHWPICGARIFQTYGPGQPRHMLVPAAISAALNGEEFPMTSGRQIRDWIHVEDVVRGLISMLQSNLAAGDTVDLGTGIGTSVADVVTLIYQMADRGGGPKIGTLPERPGEEAAQIADAMMSEAKVGWRSGVDLRDGLNQLIDVRNQP